MKNIKYIKIFFSLIFFTLISSQSKAENKMAIVDMDQVMRQSLAGKSLIIKLEKIDIDNKKYFTDRKKKLDLNKESITSQKNILSKEEYEKKVLIINKEYDDYKNEGLKRIKILEKKRDKAMSIILDELNIILSEYSKNNGLAFIIDQKNIIIGKTDLNITKKITIILDSKLKKVP